MKYPNKSIRFPQMYFPSLLVNSKMDLSCRLCIEQAMLCNEKSTNSVEGAPVREYLFRCPGILLEIILFMIYIKS